MRLDIIVKGRIKTLLRKKTFDEALIVYLASLVTFLALPFYPLPLAPLFAIFPAYIAYQGKPRIAVIVLSLLSGLAFAYQSTALFWIYLVPVSLILFFVWKHWMTIAYIHLIVFLPFLPFPLSYLSGFVYLAMLVTALNVGSKESIVLVLFTILSIFTYSTVWHKYTPFFPLNLDRYELVSYLELKPRPSLFNFMQALRIAFSNALDVRSAFLSFGPAFFQVIENLSTALFADVGILQLISWIFVLFVPAYFTGRIRLKKLGTEAVACLPVLLIPLIYVPIFMTLKKPYPIEVPFYSLLAVGILHFLNSQGFYFSRELELRKKEEASFLGFGRELTLAGSETGLEDVGGYEDVKEELKRAILMPIQHPEMEVAYGVKPARGILLFGPPGTGKTLLIRAIAKEIDYPVIYIKASELLSSLYGETEKNITRLFERAREKAPIILFFDEIDAIAKKREGYREDDPTARALTTLLQELDGYREDKPVIFVAATNVPHLLDPALLRPGRIDKVIYMRPPTKEDRKKIFEVYLRKLPHENIDLDKLAEITERFTGADIENVVKEAAKLVASRAIREGRIIPVTQHDLEEIIKVTKPSLSLRLLEEYEKFKLDFERRTQKDGVERPNLTYSDVVNLNELKDVMRTAIELPIKYPELFKKYDVTPIRGILLFGPPGTGKTFFVKATAGEFGIPLIALSGSELLKEGYARSASLLRDAFYRALENAPAIVFIDELETIVPANRSSPLLGELLQLLDGIKERKGVIFIGATNMPHLLDPALLRPGRIDKIVYMGLPDEKFREKLLRHFLKGLNVPIKELAKRTAGFTQADLYELCQQIKLLFLKAEISGKTVTRHEIFNILQKFRRSVDEELLAIYERFRKKYAHLD